jgi:hypothetical protein
MSDAPDTRILIRVVKIPTTGERLDEYYRERGLLHGGRGDTAVRGDGCRRVPARGSST